MPGRRIAGAQHVEPPLAAGTPGRLRVDANARRRQRQARQRHAHPPVSARAGEQAAAAPPCPPPRPPWPSMPSLWPPPPSWREKGEGKKWPRVSGGGPVAGFFVPAGNTDGRRIKIRRPGSGLILMGRDAAREGKEGEPSRAGLAARSLAVGPKAQEGVREPAAGQNRKRAASTEKKISSFLISEAFSIEF